MGETLAGAAGRGEGWGGDRYPAPAALLRPALCTTHCQLARISGLALYIKWFWKIDLITKVLAETENCAVLPCHRPAGWQQRLQTKTGKLLFLPCIVNTVLTYLLEPFVRSGKSQLQ